MNNTPSQSNSSRIETVFAQLNPRDIEEFYTTYHSWNLRQQLAALQNRLDDLHSQLAENTRCMQNVQPTAIALATLARLQSNGVSDIDLLDRMLEQGELWLDRTMQRLEYFEQLDDFISDDYTHWCQLALEGAYDWIDSMLDGSSTSSSPIAASEEEDLTGTTEEVFLQKLSSDEDEDESSMLEKTLKRPAITIAHPSEPVPPPEGIPVAVEVPPSVEEATPAQEEACPGDVTPASDLPLEESPTQEYVESEVSQTPAEVIPIEEPLSAERSSISNSGDLSKQAFVEVSPASEESPPTPLETLQQSEEHPVSEVPSPDSNEIEVSPLSGIPEAPERHQQNEKPKRPNVIRRFIVKIWGSQS
ncbi:MAG TPA: hypothetical protein VF844_13740 [Ktedonobacteraceae bacterium]